MEGDGSDEEISVERQIELQLGEQKESLAAINEALDSDPSNPELISVHEELILAIRDAEEGLLHLKRSRLLQEADAIILRNRSDSTGQDVKVETLDSTQVEAEPLESESYSVGSKCRFRYLDGCWYNGHIIGLDNASIATISFLTPTSENMLICKFFLQQRCRFGSNCRMSHGFNVHTSSLKHYLPTVWQQSLVGSSIWAASSNNSGVWKKAELESWDAKLRLGQVVFQDGSAAKLGVEDLSSSEFAQMSDEDDGDVEDDPSSERSESCEEEEDIENETQQGIGFLEATKLQKGIQTETAVFAKWEHHTRGIASKMMASMGYREGMGLGISGQGIIDPITVKVLPPKQSLDHALETERTGESGEIQAKKRSRGGKRKRGRKFAAAARAAKGEEDPELNVFNFINGQLASHIEVVNGLGTKQTRGSGEAAEFKKTDDRRSLVVHDEKVKELRCRLEKIEEMASRNRNKDKVVYEAASRKLDETRKALEDAEAAQSSASNAFASKEKDKRWLKF